VQEESESACCVCSCLDVARDGGGGELRQRRHAAGGQQRGQHLRTRKKRAHEHKRKREARNTHATRHLLVAGELNGVQRHGWRGERLHEELHGAAEALDGAEEGASVEAVEEEVFGHEAGRGGHHLKDVVRKERQRRGVVERQQ
jgi:hypothetical protein